MTFAPAILGASGTELTKEEVSFFRELNPYGFILFARNCVSPEQVKNLTSSLKEISGRDNLPILIDQEGGRVARLKPPHWPSYPPAGVFSMLYKNKPEQAKKATYLNARLIADDLSEIGITVDCAPLADLPVEGAHDIIGDRAFGHSPEQVIDLARAMADGLQEGGIIPVLKHIPGHGRAFVDSHKELPVVEASLNELRATDFVPFKALSDLPMAMTAHVVYAAIDKYYMATLSPVAITLIREELGFDGLLMSDDISMKAMKGDYAQRAEQTLSAGCDIVLHCNGDMKEMRELAGGLTQISEISLMRANKAMKNAGKLVEFDAAEARQIIDEIMVKAA